MIQNKKGAQLTIFSSSFSTEVVINFPRNKKNKDLSLFIASKQSHETTVWSV